MLEILTLALIQETFQYSTIFFNPGIKYRVLFDCHSIGLTNWVQE